MRAPVLGVTILLATFVSSAQPGALPAQGASERMTNDDVIKLVQAGVSEDTIIAKIAESGPRAEFDTSIDALIKLKQARVSDAVVRAMIVRPAAPGGVANSVTEAGLFAEQEGRLVRLEPTGAKGSGGFGGVNYSLAGRSARVAVVGPRPRFVFSFANAVGQLSMTGPREFVLLRLESKADARKVKIPFGGAQGTGVRFSYDEKGARQYVVTPDEPLGQGEYAFFHEPTGRFFDFSLTVGRPPAPNR